MKKIVKIALIWVALFNLSACTYYHTCKTKSYLLPYFEVKRISSAQSDENTIRVVSFRTEQEHFEYMNGWADFVDHTSIRKDFYESYAAFYNDKGYKGRASYEYHHPELQYVIDDNRVKAWPEIEKIEVIALNNYDNSHPQGSILNDIVRVKKSALYDYIQSGYEGDFKDSHIYSYYLKRSDYQDDEIEYLKQVEESFLSQFSGSDYYLMGIYIPNGGNYSKSTIDELLSEFEIPDYCGKKMESFYLYFDLKFISLPDDVVDIEVKITRIDGSVVTAQCAFDPHFGGE